MTDYTITAPNGGTWTDQLANTATVGRYHDLGFISEGAAGAASVFKQARAGVLPGPPVAAASKIPGAFAVAPTSGLNFSIQPGAVILERNTLSGLYHVQSTAVGTGAVGTADPSQTRIDLVTVDHFDGALGDNSSTTLTRVHVKAGAPGGGVPAIDVTPGARQIMGWWTIPALTTTLTSGMWTDARKSSGLRGGIRPLLPGDALSDPGFHVDELRDTTAISTQGTIDCWDAVNSVWRTILLIGAGSGYAKYTAAITATGQNQTLGTNATTPIQLINARSTCTDVVASGTNNTIFTLNRVGKWAFCASIRMAPGTTGAHFIQLIRNDTNEIIAAWFGGPLATGSIYDLPLSGEDYFATSGISVTLNVITGAGVASSGISSGNSSSGLRTFLAMQWEGA